MFGMQYPNKCQTQNWFLFAQYILGVDTAVTQDDVLPDPQS